MTTDCDAFNKLLGVHTRVAIFVLSACMVVVCAQWMYGRNVRRANWEPLGSQCAVCPQAYQLQMLCVYIQGRHETSLSERESIEDLKSLGAFENPLIVYANGMALFLRGWRLWSTAGKAICGFSSGMESSKFVVACDKARQFIRLKSMCICVITPAKSLFMSNFYPTFRRIVYTIQCIPRI